MIVFDLECQPSGHRFEGWFASSDDYASQMVRGLVTCPECGAPNVVKAPMAAYLGRKGNQQALPPQHASAPMPQHAMTAPPALPPETQAKLHAAFEAIVAVQAEALKSSRWVGKGFAEDARAMHYGDIASEPIHGQASPEEAKALIEEGVDIAPILFPVASPDEVN
jgi:hypothetical protein